ncbi:MAG: Leucine-rich repeat (LRR) protein [Myxococcota bacterium]|jgi:Leucine-rich repeat (LRR) protein
MSQLDALFGELRSLMQRAGNINHWDLSRLLRRAIAMDEARYRDEWLPYLTANRLPTFFGKTLDDIELFSRMLPAGTLLILSIELSGFDYDALADAPFTSCLTGINISYRCRLTDKRFERLVQSRHLGGLVQLDVGGNNLGDGAMIALAEATSIHQLTYLRLYHNHIQSAGACALAESPLMRQLTMLDISVNQIQDDGVAAIGASPYLCNLRNLQVYSNKIKRKGAEAFGRTTTLVNLTDLNISKNNIGNYGALALASCPALSNLTTLSVGRNRINAKGMGYLRGSAHLTKLENLYH